MCLCEFINEHSQIKLEEIAFYILIGFLKIKIYQTCNLHFPMKMQ